MARSRKYELGVGLLLAGAAGVLAWMALQVGALSSLGEKIDVETRFADANGLQEGASVAIAGVEIGTVSRMDIDFDQAVIHLALRPGADVRADATAIVRARSVLGEKYVEIVPHSRDARLVQDGDVLQAGPPQTEIDELVSSLGPLVQAIDPEVFAQLLGTLSATLAEDPERLSRMLDNADTLLANGAIASQDLPALISEGRATVTTVQRTAARADRALVQLDGLLTETDLVLDDVGAAAERLPALTEDVHLTVREARELVASFEGTKSGIDQIVDNFSGFDKWELRRLLREEGILVRLRAREVVEEENEPWDSRGSVRHR